MTTGPTNPNEGNAPLTHEQRRYLQTIFDYFCEKAEWPKRRYLERILLKEDLDARQIGKSLVGRIGYPPYAVPWDPDSVAALTVPDMALCRDSDEELDAFIKALRFVVETYVKSDAEGNVQVGSLDLMTRLHMSHSTAQKVGLMFQVEPIVHGGFGQDSIQWTMNVAHDIIEFRNVRSLDDYLAIRRKSAQPTHAFGQPISGLATEQAGRGLPAAAGRSRDVFIVHGHDEAAKESVARFIERLGLDPIILHEQANAGLTIIEKFEKHSQVAFAIVLLTPDDLGASRESPDATRPRARQNVVLELGYFLGTLGRDHVCALHKGNVELPSDFQGVLYVPMDDRGAWKMDLAREIRAAGLEVSNVF